MDLIGLGENGRDLTLHRFTLSALGIHQWSTVSTLADCYFENALSGCSLKMWTNFQRKLIHFFCNDQKDVLWLAETERSVQRTCSSLKRTLACGGLKKQAIEKAPNNRISHTNLYDSPASFLTPNAQLNAAQVPDSNSSSVLQPQSRTPTNEFVLCYLSQLLQWRPA